MNLPYPKATINASSSKATLLTVELLRWLQVNNFGMNHAATEDDWYKGYFMLQGSVIMLN